MVTISCTKIYKSISSLRKNLLIIQIFFLFFWIKISVIFLMIICIGIIYNDTLWQCYSTNTLAWINNTIFRFFNQKCVILHEVNFRSFSNKINYVHKKMTNHWIEILKVTTGRWEKRCISCWSHQSVIYFESLSVRRKYFSIVFI